MTIQNRSALKVLVQLSLGISILMFACCGCWCWMVTGPLFDDVLASGDFVIQGWSDLVYCDGETFEVTSARVTNSRSGTIVYGSVCVADDGSITPATSRKRFIDLVTAALPTALSCVMTFVMAFVLAKMFPYTPPAVQWERRDPY